MGQAREEAENKNGLIEEAIWKFKIYEGGKWEFWSDSEVRRNLFSIVLNKSTDSACLRGASRVFQNLEVDIVNESRYCCEVEKGIIRNGPARRLGREGLRKEVRAFR